MRKGGRKVGKKGGGDTCKPVIGSSEVRNGEGVGGREGGREGGSKIGVLPYLSASSMIH